MILDCWPCAQQARMLWTVVADQVKRARRRRSQSSTSAVVASVRSSGKVSAGAHGGWETPTASWGALRMSCKRTSGMQIPRRKNLDQTLPAAAWGCSHSAHRLGSQGPRAAECRKQSGCRVGYSPTLQPPNDRAQVSEGSGRRPGRGRAGRRLAMRAWCSNPWAGRSSRSTVYASPGLQTSCPKLPAGCWFPQHPRSGSVMPSKRRHTRRALDSAAADWLTPRAAGQQESQERFARQRTDPPFYPLCPWNRTGVSQSGGFHSRGLCTRPPLHAACAPLQECAPPGHVGGAWSLPSSGSERNPNPPSVPSPGLQCARQTLRRRAPWPPDRGSTSSSGRLSRSQSCVPGHHADDRGPSKWKQSEFEDVVAERSAQGQPPHRLRAPGDNDAWQKRKKKQLAIDFCPTLGYQASRARLKVARA